MSHGSHKRHTHKRHGGGHRGGHGGPAALLLGAVLSGTGALPLLFLAYLLH